MLASVHCPTCSTHYGLRASRVRAGLHRARCFRCASIFDIEAAILELVGEPSAAAVEESLAPEDLLDVQLEPEAPALEAPEAAEAGLEAQDLLDVRLEPEAPALEAPEAAAAGLEAQDLLDVQLEPEAPLPESLAAPAEEMPSLTMGDLEGMEDKLLEKTLIIEGEQSLPEALPASLDALPTPEELEPGFDSTAAGYTSAKDAIAKLLGNLPPPEAPLERRGTGRASAQMDVEATLDALESTLGGVSAKDLEPGPIVAPPESPLPPAEPARPSFSTLKLTHDEIMSAMKAASVAPPAAPTVPTLPILPAAKPTIPQFQPETDTSLLKIQVGPETYNNISMDQLTSWIEQGRVQDYHMVARQFSENWIEAGKIPALRPVFERLHKKPASTVQSPTVATPPADTAPIRKSLFSGLFNRG